MNISVNQPNVFAHSSGEKSLFDFEQLDDVMQDVPEELVQLLDSFFIDTTEEIPTLPELMKVDTQEELRRRLHTLRGISASFGLIRMAEVCAKAEEAVVAEESHESIEQKIQAILPVLQQTHNSLKKLRPEYLPAD